MKCVRNGTCLPIPRTSFGGALQHRLVNRSQSRGCIYCSTRDRLLRSRAWDFCLKTTADVGFMAVYGGESKLDAFNNAGETGMVGEKSSMVVFTTVGCKYCKRVKAALMDASIPFREIDLSNKPDVLEEVKKSSGRATVPQVFVGGELIGGADEVIKALEDGILVKALSSAGAEGKAALPEKILKIIPLDENAEEMNGKAAEEREYEVLKELAQSMREEMVSSSDIGLFELGEGATWLERNGAGNVKDSGAVKVLAKLQSSQLVTIPEIYNKGLVYNGEGINPQTKISEELVNSHPDVKLQWVHRLPFPTHVADPLNSHFRWFGVSRSAVEVSARLRSLALKLYDTHMTPDGKLVNYKTMMQDIAFDEFVNATAELQGVNVFGLERAEAMSFWINIYNALIIHATAVFGPAKNTLERLKWFDSIKYEIGRMEYSANDIEHGILRNNKPSPASLFVLLGLKQLARPTFHRQDPRSKLAISPLDPRIHFALNCGAASCPPVRVYSPERLEDGLETAAMGFCSEEVKVVSNTPKETVLELSSIFKWYGSDFGSRTDMLKFIAAHSPPKQRQLIEETLKKHGSSAIVLNYSPYDWNINSIE